MSVRAVVEMFTTTGMVFFAMAENDGGRLSRAARPAAPAHRIPKPMCKGRPTATMTIAVPCQRTNRISASAPSAFFPFARLPR